MRYEENTEQAEKGRKGRGGEERRGAGRDKKRRNEMRIKEVRINLEMR